MEQFAQSKPKVVTTRPSNQQFLSIPVSQQKIVALNEPIVFKPIVPKTNVVVEVPPQPVKSKDYPFKFSEDKLAYKLKFDMSADLIIAYDKLPSRPPDTRNAYLHKIETKLISKGTQCPSVFIDDASAQIFQDSYTNVFKLLQTIGTLDEHNGTKCLIDAALYSPYDDRFALGVNDQIRRFVKRLKPLGKQGIQGQALTLSVEGYNDAFVVKTAIDPDHDDSVHEAFVGLFCLNELRKTIPNFMFVYGIFYCTPPIIHNGEVQAFCSIEGPKVGHLVIENIKGAMSMREFCTTCTAEEFRDAYYQIMFALHIAHRHCDYTHYDLHYDNVLVRRLNTPVTIGYKIGDKMLYATYKVLANIIDFGYSHVEVDGYSFDHYGLEIYGVIPKTSFPAYDTYKLLCFCALSAMIAKNDQVTAMADKLFSIYGEGSIAARVLKRTDTDFFAAPEPLRKLTYIDIIGKSQAVVGFKVVEVKPTTGFFFDGSATTFLDSFVNSIADRTAKPRNIADVCSVANALQEGQIPNQEGMVEWLGQNFNFPAMFKADLKAAQTQMNLLLNYLNSAAVPDINTTQYVGVKGAMEKLIVARDRVHEVNKWMIRAECAGQVLKFKVDDIKKALEPLKATVDAVIKRYDEIVLAIMSQKINIDVLALKPDKTEAGFWKKVFPTYLAML